MHEIVKKIVLTPKASCFEIKAPRVAKKARPGQFVIVRLDSSGERIPLTIADYNTEKETINIVVQEEGYTSRKIGALNEGATILDITGPLGQPTKISKVEGAVVLVGGGLGIAPIYPIASAFKHQGNQVEVILGARNKEFLFWEERFRKDIDGTIHLVTDDGSVGRKGFVTEQVKDIILEKKVGLVVAIGPMVMMRAVASVVPKEIETIVSMNTLMVDGTGMCGSCRLSVGGQTKYACVDGPDFDGHQIDWQEVMTRNLLFKEEEAHICKMNL